MNIKIRKLLFLLTRNSRTNLKTMSTQLHISPQAVSYHIKKLEDEKIITYTTLTDHIKLGFINVLVGLDLKSYTAEIKRKIIMQLKKETGIITIIKGESGIDLLIEIQARNLSHFNKNFTKFMADNSQNIQTRFIHPIIVKHTYPRNYLVKKPIIEDIITLGDREYKPISEDEEKVLSVIQENPKITLIELAKKTKLGVKKVLTCKKNLEKKAIIRKYSCLFKHKKLDIQKKILLLKTKDEFNATINLLTEFCKVHPNIVEYTKLIGRYNIMIITESLKQKNILEELRKEFPIQEHLVIEVDN